MPIRFDMERLRKTGGHLAAAGWGVVLIGCDLVEIVRRRSLLYGTSAAILAALLVIVLPGAGGGHAAAEVPSATATEAAAPAEATDPAPAQPAPAGRFVEVGGYSLTLPDGWRTTARPPGSAFAATSADGLATTTLWIRRNPGLDLDSFERRAKRDLGKLGRNVEVLDRVNGATVADSSVELGAEVPVGNDLVPADQRLVSVYRVTLRSSGPYRFYLATTVEPGAPAGLLDQVRDLSRNLRPWLAGAS